MVTNSKMVEMWKQLCDTIADSTGHGLIADSTEHGLISKGNKKLFSR
jgi:hypothetical protein